MYRISDLFLLGIMIAAGLLWRDRIV